MEFNEILNSLLAGYEQQDKGQDFDTFLKKKGQELGLSEEGMKKVEDASALIDNLALNIDSLQKAKEEGHSVKRWMMDKLEESLKPLEEGESKEKLVSILAEHVEKSMEVQLKRIEK